MRTISSQSDTVKLDHLYAIGRVITAATEWKPALDEIAQLIRSILIFDNLAVYLSDDKNNSVEVMYAKAVGRGRSAEADISWGDTLALQVMQTSKTLLVESDAVTPEDRLQHPFFFGIPLIVNQRCLGVLVFIRFGGPAFTIESQHLAEFIAQQITMLIEFQNLKKDYQTLIRQQQQSLLQENFISTITHELRNPLGFIKGYTTTLLRSDTKWDESTQLEFLQIIDHETDRLEELIENLLDSARLQSGQMQMQFQTVLIETLINAVVTRSRMHYPDLNIEAVIEKPLSPILADPGRLAQVLENLISNAVKYAPGAAVILSAANEGNFVHITVQDFGSGIASEYINNLFQRFYRIPEQAPNVHGSGLGLYICRQIVQAHLGKITVDSQQGKGTRFHIYLPQPAESGENSKEGTK